MTVPIVALCFTTCCSAWAKRRATVGAGAEDGTIAEYFWIAMFALGGMLALALVVAGAYLVARNYGKGRAMKAIGKPHGLRYNGLVFKRGFGRRAPSFCPACLASAGRVVSLQLERSPPTLMVRDWWLKCPNCRGTWRVSAADVN